MSWYDATDYSAVGEPARETTLQVPWAPKRGSAETILTALVASWPEDRSPLTLGDWPCRWLGISATGPGDLRGVAAGENGATLAVAAELKAAPKGSRGVGRAAFRKAVDQAVIGLERIHETYQTSVSDWLGWELSLTEGVIALVADAWSVGTPEAESDLLDRLGAMPARSPGFRMRARVIAVSRYQQSGRPLVRVEPLVDLRHVSVGGHAPA